jgi:hypothetical protein
MGTEENEKKKKHMTVKKDGKCGEGDNGGIEIEKLKLSSKG